MKQKLPLLTCLLLSAFANTAIAKDTPFAIAIHGGEATIEKANYA